MEKNGESEISSFRFFLVESVSNGAIPFLLLQLKAQTGYLR